MSSRVSVAISAPLGDGSLTRSSPKIASIVGDLASALAQVVEEIFRNRRLVVKQVRSAENLLWIHRLELSLTSYTRCLGDPREGRAMQVANYHLAADSKRGYSGG